MGTVVDIPWALISPAATAIPSQRQNKNVARYVMQLMGVITQNFLSGKTNNLAISMEFIVVIGNQISIRGVICI